MAEFTNIDLRVTRESRKMPRWKLAGEIGVSEDTIERWETGKQRPEPDDVWNIEKVLDATGIWHKWMLSHYDSYRKKYSDVPDVEGLTGNVVLMKYEMRDVLPFIDSAERDTLDGNFDDFATWHKLKKEIPEAMAAMQKVLERIPDGI